MNDLVNDTVKNLNDETVYRASVHFYSKGNDGNVTLAVDVSHILDDEYQGPIPAAYAHVYELVMKIRRDAVLYAASDEDNAFLADPDISPEDKASMVLEKVAAQEEAANATIN